MKNSGVAIPTSSVGSAPGPPGRSVTEKRSVDEPKQTLGELFPDGGGIDVVLDENARPRLLLVGREQERIAARVRANGRLYEPARLDPSIIQAMALPTRCMPYGTTRKLFLQVSQAISRATHLAEPVVGPLVYFVFATWLIEFLPVAPCFWVVVPATASAAALAHILRLVCRRALVVPELTTTGLRSLPTGLRPTVIATVSRVTRELQRALHASSRPGLYLPSGSNDVVDLFCAKIVFAKEPLRDAAAAGYPVEIALTPTLDYVPPMNSRDSQRVMADLQGQLLRYRLVNHAKLTAPNLDLGGLTAPMREAAHALAMCIVDEVELQSQVLRFVKPQDRQIQADQASVIESIILEGLLAACHDTKADIVSILKLTQTVNTIVAGRGEPFQVSPEIVGWKLRALGIGSQFIAGGRKGLRLLDATRVRIHELATAYGVRTMRIGVIDGICSQCAQSRSPLVRPGGSDLPRKIS